MEKLSLYLKNKWVSLQKSKLRRRMHRLRQALNINERRSKSADIMHIIEKMPLFQKAKVVMLYYPIGHEVDSSLLLHKFHEEKTLLLPSVVNHELEVHQYIGQNSLKKGRFNIPEPTTPVWEDGEIDLIVVPGMAFDRQKFRMGRGGGYYDRFLADYQDVPTIGVAYDFQVVDHLPVHHHDQQMDYIVTDKGIIVNA